MKNNKRSNEEMKRLRGVNDCMKRMAEKIEMIKNYLMVTGKALDYPGAIRLSRLQSEITLNYLFSLYEGTLICMVYQGMIADKKKTLDFYPGNEDVKNIVANWSKRYQDLHNYAAKIVLFRDKKLPKFKNDFKYFLDKELFVNDRVERIIWKFKDYRNILIHHQGIVEKSYLDKIGPTPEIVKSKIVRVYGRDILYELDREKLKEFIVQVLLAILENIKYYGGDLQTDDD